MHQQSSPYHVTEPPTRHIFAEAGRRGRFGSATATPAALWALNPSNLGAVAPASPAALVWGAWPPGSTIDVAPFGPYWCDVRGCRDGFAWTVTDSWTGEVIARGWSSYRGRAMAHAGLSAVTADIPEPLSVRAARAFGDWS